MVRVAVFGANGRMGAEVCRAVEAADDLELVAAVDAGDPRDEVEAKAQVVVDFSVAAASRVAVPWLAMHGIHAVVGTTGFTDDDLAAFRTAFSGSNCLVASNFAISAVLMMRFAELAAPQNPDSVVPRALATRIRAGRRS